MLKHLIIRLTLLSSLTLLLGLQGCESDSVSKKEPSQESNRDTATSSQQETSTTEKQDVSLAAIQVYKSPTCGCCGKWIDHIEDGGFTAEVTDSQQMSQIKDKLGIKSEYRSCHTATVDNYVFEGHIPVDAMKAFLKEKPENAIGLAVPNMPVGSPGMEMGDRHDDYDVLLLMSDGSSRVFRHISKSKSI